MIVVGRSTGDLEGDGSGGNSDAFVAKLLGADKTVFWAERFGAGNRSTTRTDYRARAKAGLVYNLCDTV